ncbi:MAG: hypothetical protein E2O47_03080 [Gemmatimonadetes bacterium]|nr:MAG: hypothetical protein E2O47_03080 [Gemmatimonadota bacterium]
MRNILLSGLCWVALGCGGGGGQFDEPERPAPEELEAIKGIQLRAELFAGQDIPVLPITLVVPDSSLAAGELFQHRDVLLKWTDSIIQFKLENRAPDVGWKFPPELRRLALRSPGIIPDPDRMGQSVLRTPALNTVPDPFRSNLRTLVAVTGGRLAFVPAAAVFRQPEPGVVEASLMIVMADSRTGRVVWRSLAVGEGGNLAYALSAALDDVLPLQIFAE